MTTPSIPWIPRVNQHAEKNVGCFGLSFSPIFVLQNRFMGINTSMPFSVSPFGPFLNSDVNTIDDSINVVDARIAIGLRSFEYSWI